MPPGSSGDIVSPMAWLISVSISRVSLRESGVTNCSLKETVERVGVDSRQSEALTRVNSGRRSAITSPIMTSPDSWPTARSIRAKPVELVNVRQPVPAEFVVGEDALDFV
jgi:hypothetical protein